MNDAQPWEVGQSCTLTQSGLNPRDGVIVAIVKMTDLEAFPGKTSGGYLAPGDPNIGRYSSYQVTVEFFVQNEEPGSLEDRVSRIERILDV